MNALQWQERIACWKLTINQSLLDLLQAGEFATTVPDEGQSANNLKGRCCELTWKAWPGSPLMALASPEVGLCLKLLFGDSKHTTAKSPMISKARSEATNCSSCNKKLPFPQHPTRRGITSHSSTAGRGQVK